MPRRFKSRFLRLLAHPAVLVLTLAYLIVDVLNLPNGPKELSSVALALRGMQPTFGSGPRPLPLEFYRTDTGLVAIGTARGEPGAGFPPGGGVKVPGLQVWPRDYTTHGFWAPTRLVRSHTVAGLELLTAPEIASLPRALCERLEAMGYEERTMSLVRMGVLADTQLIRRGVARDVVALGAGVFLLVNATLILTLLARWRTEERRRTRGLCPTCGYNLRHQFIGGCPECGWGRAPVKIDHRAAS